MPDNGALQLQTGASAAAGTGRSSPPPSETVQNAMRELFTMRNNIDDENSLDENSNGGDRGTKGIADVSSSHATAGSTGTGAAAKSSVQPGEVTSILNEFRNKRKQELEAQRAVKRKAMQDALLSTPLAADEDEDEQGAAIRMADEPGGAYDPGRYVNGTGSNRFYTDYSNMGAETRAEQDEEQEHGAALSEGAGATETQAPYGYSGTDSAAPAVQEQEREEAVAVLGWDSYWSEEHGAHYYIHQSSGESSWEVPAPDPAFSAPVRAPKEVSAQAQAAPLTPEQQRLAQLGSEDNTSQSTPEPLSDFYQFVRSPPRSALTPLGGKQVASGGASGNLRADNANNDHISSELMAPLGGEGSLVSEMSEDGEDISNMPQSSNPNTPGSGETDVVGGEMHYNLVSLNTGSGASVMSEPIMDPEAMENTLKNQAMLYQSAQQLQLGGMVSSWALGGSVESVGQNLTLGQQAFGSTSMEKLDGNMQNDTDAMRRSVTFASENEVKEFASEDSEFETADIYNTPQVSRGSQLEDEWDTPILQPQSSGRHPYEQASNTGSSNQPQSIGADPFFIPPFNSSKGKDIHGKSTGVPLPVQEAPASAQPKPLFSDVDVDTGDMDAGGVSFPQMHGRTLVSDEDETIADLEGLDGEKGMILGDDADDANRVNQLGTEYKRPTNFAFDSTSDTASGSLGADTAEKSALGANPKRGGKKKLKKTKVVKKPVPLSVMHSQPEQVFYTGKGNQKIISPPSSPPQAIRGAAKRGGGNDANKKKAKRVNTNSHPSAESKEHYRDNVDVLAYNSRYSIGSRIMANYRGQGNWYSGVVTGIFSNGSHALEFDNGEKDSGYLEDLLKFEGESLDSDAGAGVGPVAADDKDRADSTLDMDSSESATAALEAPNRPLRLVKVSVATSASTPNQWSSLERQLASTGHVQAEKDGSVLLQDSSNSASTYRSAMKSTAGANAYNDPKGTAAIFDEADNPKPKGKRNMESFNRLCKPLPDKTAKPKALPRTATDCPNIPFDTIDDAQHSTIGDSLTGVFPPGTDKVRIILRAQVDNDDDFKSMVKKLPKPKKQYGRTEIKLFPDSNNTLEPEAIVASLFGGHSKQWRQLKVATSKAKIAAQAASTTVEQQKLGETSTPTTNAPSSTPAPSSPDNLLKKWKKMTSSSTTMKTDFANREDFTHASAGRNSSILSGQPVGPYSTMHFLRRFSKAFACVAVDFYMNFLGTYDINSGNYMPGMDFDPRLINKSKSVKGDVLSLNNAELAGFSIGKRSKERPSIRQANAMEIDLSVLPSNVFALIPIIYDESDPSVPEEVTSLDDNGQASRTSKMRGDIPKIMKNLKFDCCMYSRRSSSKEEVLASADDFDIPDQANVCNEINGQDQAITDALRVGRKTETKERTRIMKRKDQDRILKSHLRSVSGGDSDEDDKNKKQEDNNDEEDESEFLWTQDSHFLYERASNAHEKVTRRSSIVQITQNLIKAIPLGLREALMPFVMYRRSLEEKGWAWKSLKTVTKGVQSHDTDHVLNTILESLVSMRVMPFHAIHVEHCDNCEDHAMTTKHKPGHYFGYYEKISQGLHAAIPQLISQNNLDTMLVEDKEAPGHKPGGSRFGMKEPRVGSFEVIMRPYCSPVSQLIFSKLASHAFPRIADLTNVMKGYLHPLPMVFDNPIPIDIIMYSDESKRPVPNVLVVVYMIDVAMKSDLALSKERAIQREGDMQIIEESDEESENSHSDDEAQNDENEDDEHGVPNLSPSPTKRNPTGNTSRENNKKLRSKKFAAFSLKDKKDYKKTVSLRDVSHSVIQNPTFSALGSWGKRDVLAWLESHGVSQDTKFFAEQAGVTNGHSLITLVNVKNLKAWKCTNKRVITSILRDIERMQDSVQHDHPDNVGLSNHRIQHMVETTKMMGRSIEMNNSVAPNSGVPTMNTRPANQKSSSLSSMYGASSTSIMKAMKTQKLGRHVDLQEVGHGMTSSIGMLRCDLAKVGSYLVKVSSPNHETVWSHVIQIGADAEDRHLLWAAKISAKLGLLRLKISATCIDTVETLGSYTEKGLMVPFTNVNTLKQHVMYVPFTKSEADYVIVECFFPVGRYFCNVDGSIVEIVGSTAGMRRRNMASKTKDETKIDVTFEENERAVLKAHNRTIFWAAQGLQSMKRFLRKMHAKRLTNKLGLGIRVAVVMHGYLRRARARLLPVRMTRIQTCWRRYWQTHLYKEILRKRDKQRVVQRLMRRREANKSWNFVTVFVKMFLKLRKKVNARRLIKARTACIAIQCLARRKAAYNKLNFQKKLRACSNQSLFVFKTLLLMKVLRRRRQKAKMKEETYLESHNCGQMAKEEEYMRNLIIEQEFADRAQAALEARVVRENLRQLEMRKVALELKKNKTATHLQAWARGCDVRNWIDLYTAKSRGLVHTVYGGRPFRKTMYFTDSDSDEDSDKHTVTKLVAGEVVVDDSAPFLKRMTSRASNSFLRTRHHMKLKISEWVNSRVKRELEESRRLAALARQPVIQRRKGLIGTFIPGEKIGLPEIESESESDEEREVVPELSAFKRYVYEPDLVSQETKDRYAEAKAHLEEKMKEVYKDAKEQMKKVPGMIAAPIKHATLMAASALVTTGKTVGFAGVRNLRRLKKQIASKKLPTRKEIKDSSVKFIQDSVEFPKKVVVQSGLVRLQSKDMQYMTEQQKQSHSVTIMQSAYRGYKCRTELLKDPDYRVRLAALVQVAIEDKAKRLQAEAEAKIAEERAIIKAAALAEQLEAEKLKSKEMNLTPRSKEAAKKEREEAKKPPKIVSVTEKLKNFSEASVGALVHATGSVVAKTNEVIKDAAMKAKKSAEEWTEKKKLSMARDSRRSSASVGLSDALLQIAGTLTHCPVLDRQWHIGVYPKGSVISNGILGNFRGVNVAGADKPSFSNKPVADYDSDHTLTPKSGGNAAGAVKSGDQSEYSRSNAGYPLNKQTFAGMSYFAHLTDITRYQELEVVLFIETLGLAYGPTSGTIPNAPYDSNSQSSINANSMLFAPAFYAPISLNGGAAFPPCGGRMHVKLKPNPTVLGRLPKAKSFLNMDGLGVVVSLVPVSLPPSSFLRTFRGYTKPAPCYPSSLVDAPLLDGCSIAWGPRNGPAIAAGSFRDRILLSCRNNGSSPGVFEYTNKGVCIGQVNEFGAEKIGDVTTIVGGLKHVACCSTNGVIMVLEFVRSKEGLDGHRWGKPLYLVNHDRRQPIAAACMTNHANMDILITADRAGNIGVAILDSGKCIRHYQNENFVYPARITSLVVNAMRLYVGVSDGSMTVVSLYEIFESGLIDKAANLEDFILSRESCFMEEAGITCLATVSANRFMGFQEEDDATLELGNPLENNYIKGKKARKLKTIATLEGHLVLAGGGDADPTVKVLQPQAKGIRLLTTLVGHTKSITAIQADASGRYFFTASAGDHKVIIWDGMTFKQERVLSDLFITNIALGNNCLAVASAKSPYVRMWSVREEDHVHAHTSSSELSDEEVDDLDELQHSHSLTKRKLHHEAMNLSITTLRNADWCHDRLKGLPLNPLHKHALQRSSNYDGELNKVQNIAVLKRWLTQYFRVESLPSVYPGFLKEEIENTEGAKGKHKSGKSTSSLVLSAESLYEPVTAQRRSRERREENKRREAENTRDNSLPGSPQHTRAVKALSKIGPSRGSPVSSPKSTNAGAGVGTGQSSPNTQMRNFISNKMSGQNLFPGQDDDGEDAEDSASSLESSPVTAVPTRTRQATFIKPGGAGAAKLLGNLDRNNFAKGRAGIYESSDDDNSDNEELAGLGIKSATKASPVTKGAVKGWNDENGSDDDDADDDSYNRLFPGVSSEKQIQDCRIDKENQANDGKRTKESARKQHRHNHFAHFSDSDDDDYDKIKYLKPIKLTKAEIRARNSESSSKTKEWVTNTPSSQRSLSPIEKFMDNQPQGKVAVSIVSSPPDPKNPHARLLELFYNDDGEDKNDAQARDIARYWQASARRKTRKKEFFKASVRDLRDVDFDSD